MSISIKQSRGKLIGASLLGIISAVVANSIVYGIFSTLDAIPDTILSPFNNEPITNISIIIDTTIGTLGASLVYVGFLAWVKQPIRRYQILSAILLILSFAYPLLIEDIPLKMYLALNVMHIIAAAVIVGVLTTFANPDSTQPI